MNMLRGSLFFFALTGLTLASAQDSVTKAGLFKYNAPAGYKRDDSRVPAERIGFFSRTVDGYSSNVMITIANAGNYTVAKLGKETVDYMKANDKTSTVLRSAPTKLGGKEAFVIEMERNIQDGVMVRQQQVLSINKGKALIFTFSSLKKSFATAKPKFEASLKSFSWLP